MYLGSSEVKIIVFFLLSVCTNGEVRLAGGSTISEGRIEVCQDQSWGTICGLGMTPREASVVCRQLGFSARGD